MVEPAAATDVFISYARENRGAAQRLADALVENRLRVWWDRDLVPGSEFAAAIEAQLIGAAVVVGLWSQDSVRSAFVRDECAWALRADKLVPVRIEEVDLPLGFGQLHTLDLLDWDGDADDAAFQALLLEIERRRGQRLAAIAARSTSGASWFASLRGVPRATRRALLLGAAAFALGGIGYYAKHTLDRREADQHFRAGLDFQYAAVPRLENALNEYLSALERLPGHARARYYLAHVYAQTGRKADALVSFRLALSATEASLDRGQRLDAERQLVALAPEAGEAAPVTRSVATAASSAVRP
ncbi:MAG TPA: toll/interleukin-1 receptor domain-containing protein, partial [Burkholderiaceae bacterium]|nr:toll/interleukin-1 receptor domain-containing protein [Burkholderiaceae bacterium]